MIYTTRALDAERTPLLVGQFHEDSVVVRTPKGEILRVSRFDVETPVLCCDRCGKAALLRKDKVTGKQLAECPDNARHQYETFYAASHDVEHYDRKQRRDLAKQAQAWLGQWRREFERRVKTKVDTDMADMAQSVEKQ